MEVVGLALFFAQIAMSLYILLMVRKVPGSPKELQSMRWFAWMLGFTPCVGFAIVVQVLLLRRYQLRMSQWFEGQSAKDAFDAAPGQETSSSENPFL